MGEFEDGRALPVTWAKQRIDHLNRDMLNRQDPTLVDEIVLISLTYQILSPYTAFVAVDEHMRTGETREGKVLLKEVLTRIPTGRSYESAVSMAVGVTGGRGNQSLGDGATHENTYLLDGANIADPVTTR